MIRILKSFKIIFRSASITVSSAFIGFGVDKMATTHSQKTRASIVDLSMTKVVDGDLVKVMSWYDNEWGYTNQMIREAVRIARECLE